MYLFIERERERDKDRQRERERERKRERERDLLKYLFTNFGITSGDINLIISTTKNKQITRKKDIYTKSLIWPCTLNGKNKTAANI